MQEDAGFTTKRSIFLKPNGRGKAAARRNLPKEDLRVAWIPCLFACEPVK